MQLDTTNKEVDRVILQLRHSILFGRNENEEIKRGKKKRRKRVGGCGLAIALELPAMIPYMDFLVVGQWHIFSFHRIKGDLNSL